MSTKRWPNVPYLDAIRPEYGWRTEFAVLSSYSADLVVLTASLLALAGVDDDRGTGSKVDFANTIDLLADKVRLLVQAGRLVSPVKSPRILTILDRYVREMNPDEAVGAWHAKIAFAKQVNDGGDARWRLWIGSRNLTRDLSWDVGLVLTGFSGGDGVEVEGLPQLGETLVRHAALPGVSPGRVRSDLRRVRWNTPTNCRVKSLRLLEDGSDRGLPSSPEMLNRLVVISPFLDGTVIRELGGWGRADTKRVLVSSRHELAKLAQQAGRPLAGFTDLLCMDSSSAGQLAPEPGDDADSLSQDEEPEPRGLHAKIILAERPGGGIIWTGSANATIRGWHGPNTEVVTELHVGGDSVAGLSAFVDELATTVRLDELGTALEPDPMEDRLEAARKHVVCQWRVMQKIHAGVPALTNDSDPNPPDVDISLEVGLLGGISTLWPRGATGLNLAPVSPSDVTELVACTLRLRESVISWLQRAPLDPPPGNERDRAALASYLDPRTFLSWIRSLLTGEQVDEAGGDWDQTKVDARHSAIGTSGPSWWAPTIEDVLKAWSRDPESLRLVDKRITQYLTMYREQTDLEQSPERQIVEEFERTWTILRRELVGANR